MKVQALLALASLFMATGCMSNDTIDDLDVNEDKLHGHYRASYDENTNKLNFWAQLRAGGDTGTTVRLAGGHLSVDGHEMNERYGDEVLFNLRGTYYFLKQTAVSMEDSYSINWDRSDGERITNQVSIPGPVTITSHQDHQVVPNRSLTIEFSGPATTGREITEVIISGRDPDTQRHLRTISKRVTAGDEVTFSRLEMISFRPNTDLTVQLIRKTFNRPQAGHSAEGGVIEAAYAAKQIQLVVRATED